MWQILSCWHRCRPFWFAKSKLGSKFENTSASFNESMVLSTRKMAYLSSTFTVLRHYLSTRVRKLQLFFGTNTTGGVHSAMVVSTTRTCCILPITSRSGSRVLRPARYDAERTGRVSVGLNVLRCYATVILWRCPSHMNSYIFIIFINGALYSSNS